MSDSSYDLEAKAAEERRRLHTTVAELRSCFSDAINIRKNVARHLEAACGAAAIIGLIFGYSVTGIFAARKLRRSWVP